MSADRGAESSGSSLIASSADGRLIETDSTVTLHFSLTLADGQQIDATQEGKPATFTVGDGKLLPGFETALLGLGKGAERKLQIPADEAFGPHRPENVQRIEAAKFAELEREPGMIVSFDGPGGELPGVVTGVEGEWVVVDFNHPLAGCDIIFDVSILAVR